MSASINIKSGCGGAGSRLSGSPAWRIDRVRGGLCTYGHDERLKIIETVTARTPEVDSQWSHRLIAEALDEVGISASQVGRILADLDLKPHLVRGWLTRPDDPDFAERAVDVCGLEACQVVCVSGRVRLSVGGRDSVGVDEGQLLEGLFPVRRDLPFDEPAGRLAVARRGVLVP